MGKCFWTGGTPWRFLTTTFMEGIVSPVMVFLLVQTIHTLFQLNLINSKHIKDAFVKILKSKLMLEGLGSFSKINKVLIALELELSFNISM